MDYKEKVELLKWHVQYSELNGTDAKTLGLLIADCNYKSGEIFVSLDDIAKTINASKVAVAKTINKLLKDEAIVLVEKSSGKRPSNYRVSNLERLNFLFEGSDKNPKQSKWEKSENELFDDVILEQNKIEEGRIGCKACKAENENIGDEDEWTLCTAHLFGQRDFESTTRYKKYKLWLMDNPEPSFKVRTIKGKIVE